MKKNKLLIKGAHQVVQVCNKQQHLLIGEEMKSVVTQNNEEGIHITVDRQVDLNGNL